MVGWHHQLNGREFEQALGVDGQGSLACCSPWGHKDSDITQQQNNSLRFSVPPLPFSSSVPEVCRSSGQSICPVSSSYGTEFVFQLELMNHSTNSLFFSYLNTNQEHQLSTSSFSQLRYNWSHYKPEMHRCPLTTQKLYLTFLQRSGDR